MAPPRTVRRFGGGVTHEPQIDTEVEPKPQEEVRALLPVDVWPARDGGVHTCHVSQGEGGEVATCHQGKCEEGTCHVSPREV